MIPREFYSQFQGHPVPLLDILHKRLREDGYPDGERPCVFLVGDSSLDNKFWFHNCADAVNGYEQVLDPPRMTMDVAYWLNYMAARKFQSSWFCLNCSVEASTLRDRAYRLLEQDRFVTDHLQETDTVIASLGGNDIALRPSLSTIFHMLRMIYVASRKTFDVEYSSCNFCGQWTCGSCWANLPTGSAHFIFMFRDKIQRYLERLCAKVKPKRIILCMIYHPLADTTQDSWADFSLRMLRYNSNPAKLQAAIRFIFKAATCHVRVQGVQEIIPFPLFEVLDGTEPCDYIDRVEPSVQGGRKMARAFTDAMN